MSPRNPRSQTAHSPSPSSSSHSWLDDLQSESSEEEAGNENEEALFNLPTSAEEEDNKEESIFEESESPTLAELMATRPSRKIKISKEETKTKKGFDVLLFEKSKNDKEDSITILKFILLYYSNTGDYPAADSVLLHSFIKNLVKVDISAELLREKILKLENKFKKIVEDKGDPDFSRPYEQEIFEMSKKIWGNEANQYEEIENLEAEKGTDLSMYPFLKGSLELGGSLNAKDIILHEFMVEGLSLLGKSKIEELNEKWRKLTIKELEFHLKKLELVREQTELFLEALKKSSQQ